MNGTNAILATLFCLSFLMASLAFHFVHAAPPKRIALLPFKINAEKKYSYLDEGIFNMLTSRLSKSGHSVVLGRTSIDMAIQSFLKSEKTADIDEATARRLGTYLQTDFILFGSLTILGKRVSVESKMVDVSGRKQTGHFFKQGRKLENIIFIMDLLGADFEKKMLGRTYVATRAKAGSVRQTTSPPTRSTPTELGNDWKGTLKREDWLLSLNPKHFTIQVMGVHNEDFLLTFIIKNHLLQQSEIAYYQTTLNGKIWYRLLSGIYPTRSGAQRAIHRFPETLLHSKPWICSISTVQKAIRSKPAKEDNR